MLKDAVDYRDLGPEHLDNIAKKGTQRRLVRRLESLGFQVSLTPA
jgi:hypothetical protein